MKLWRQDKLPHSPWPIESASLETEGHGPGLGPSEQSSRASFVGMGWACSALLSPPWVHLSFGFQAGVWPPQALSTLSVGLPCLLVSPQGGLHAPVLLPDTCGTDQVPGCPALGASLTPCHCVPTTMQAMSGARVSELRGGSHTQPSSSTPWLERDGLSGPLSLGLWGSMASGVSGAWGRGAV